MSNLELFDTTCMLVLGKLYSQHPLPIEEFRDHHLELFNINSISDETNRKRKIVGESIAFLKENGYILYRGAYDSDTGIPKYGMRLTAKGLSVLRNKPDGLGIKANSVGDIFSKKARDLSNTALDEIIKNSIKLIFS